MRYKNDLPKPTEEEMRLRRLSSELSDLILVATAPADKPELSYVHQVGAGFPRDQNQIRLLVRVLPDTPSDMIALLPTEYKGETIVYEREPMAELCST